jgi:hypothetical protein
MDMSQAFSIGELNVSHAEKLILAEKLACLVVSTVASRAPVEAP